MKTVPMIDEGYIKYHCDWKRTNAIAHEAIANMTRYRDALHQLDFIGVLENGVGFGNISQRVSSDAASPQFNISGTQTGALSTLRSSDYARVTSFDSEQNSLTCEGLRKASSESLTHGVIYAIAPTVGAIIHVHHAKLWKALLHEVPTTRLDVAYGTPEMAKETQRLFQDTHLPELKIFTMAGHEDGVVTFGETLDDAYKVLIDWALRASIFSQSESETALRLPLQLTLQNNSRNNTPSSIAA